MVLLQDDDLYDQQLFGWLDDAIRASTLYNAAIVGGNNGSDIDCSFFYKPGDLGLLTAQFCSGIDEDGKSYYVLGDYQRMLINSDFSGAYGMAPNRFVASSNRAPQLINITKALHLNLFPEELKPYQFDDYYNCF